MVHICYIFGGIEKNKKIIKTINKNKEKRKNNEKNYKSF